MLNLSFLDKLNDKEKYWMTLAIAGMVVADGVIDKRELNDLGIVLLNLESIDQAGRLMIMLKNKDVPKLPMIEMNDRKLAVQMLLAIAKVGIVDNNLSNREANFLIYAGAVLNFPKEFTNKILKWAKKQSELNMLQETFRAQGKNIDNHDTTLIGEYLERVEAKNLP